MKLLNIVSGFLVITTWLAIITAPQAVAANKTITIKGFSDDSGDTIELPDDAVIGVAVNDAGITLTLPDVDVRVRCLGEATAEGYCYLSAANGGAGLDSDSDGVPDAVDECPGTGGSTLVNNVGCANSQQDDDSDGVPNGSDQCSATPAGVAVDANGCSDAQNFPDADGDGVTDANDQCPNTDAGVTVDSTGCEPDSSSPGSAAYCENTPTNVVCSRTVNFDPWWGSTGEREVKIPNGKIVSMPFTVRAQDGDVFDAGYMQYTTNQTLPNGYSWRYWYSATPGGAALTTGRCLSSYSQARDVPKWQQKKGLENSSISCHLGLTERILYLNYRIVKSGTTELGRSYVFDVAKGYDP